MKNSIKQSLLPIFTLFTSLGTLLCCALPALLATLGAGAALAGLFSAAPWLTVFSEHKVITFSVAGTLLLITGLLRWRARYAPCPIDPKLGQACGRLRVISSWMFWASVAIYIIGFFFAFIAVHIFY